MTFSNYNPMPKRLKINISDEEREDVKKFSENYGVYISTGYSIAMDEGLRTRANVTVDELKERAKAQDYNASIEISKRLHDRAKKFCDKHNVKRSHGYGILIARGLDRLEIPEE